MSAGLLAGYKQTEVGVIPSTWRDVSLGKVVTFQRGFDLPHHSRKPGIVPIVTSAGSTDFHNESRVNPPGVVTGRYGTIGQIFFVLEPFWPLNTTLYVRDFHGNDPRFVYYLLHRFDFHSFSGKSGVPGVNRNDLHLELVALPETIDEQRAIAAALSDVDALLGGLERLIAKKRDLKQAAMQQLLTGQTRLPGFSGEWEVKRFGEVAVSRKDRIDPRRAGVQEFCVELEHMEQGTGCLAGSGSTGEESSLKSVFITEDVLFGKLRAYLRKYWLADRSGVCSTEIWVLVANRNLVAPVFLFQLVTFDPFIEAASTAYGTHMPRSDWNVVKNYVVAIPKLEEQTAIATILSDMDTELAALEARRDKTRGIKQGMMQELLTGRIRLLAN